MEFTSEMKNHLKKIYKSFKKGLNSFFTTLGFNKKESEKMASSTCKNVTKNWKQMGINENVINEWSSIATNASREGKKHQISLPQTGQAELQKMIDKNGRLVPIQSHISTNNINSPATKINPIPKPQRIKDIQKIYTEFNQTEQNQELEQEK